MLKKCVTCNTDDDGDGIDVKLNCIVNSACCAEGRIKDIEVIETAAAAHDVTDQEAEVQNATEDESINKDRRDDVETHLLQSEPSRRASICESTSSGRQNAVNESETVANETGNLHAASECEKTLSDAKVLCQHD